MGPGGPALPPAMQERFPALQELVVYGMPIDDLSPLSGCTGLRKIDLRARLVDPSLSALRTCIGLEDVRLNFCNVADISPLAACANLQRLDLE